MTDKIQIIKYINIKIALKNISTQYKSSCQGAIMLKGYFSYIYIEKFDLFRVHLFCKAVPSALNKNLFLIYHLFHINELLDIGAGT